MSAAYIAPAMLERIIPTVPLVTVKPRPLNDRLWQLHAKCADRTATPDELNELESLCNALEADSIGREG